MAENVGNENRVNRLTDAQRDRLAGLLEMLGSAHDGECASFARKANSLVRDAGWTWRDLFIPGSDDGDPLDADPLDDYDQDDIAEKVSACFEHVDDLKKWDANFIRSVRRYEHLTPRQCKVVVRIFESL